MKLCFIRLPSSVHLGGRSRINRIKTFSLRLRIGCYLMKFFVLHVPVEKAPCISSDLIYLNTLMEAANASWAYLWEKLFVACGVLMAFSLNLHASTRHYWFRVEKAIEPLHIEIWMWISAIQFGGEMSINFNNCIPTEWLKLPHTPFCITFYT